MPLLSLWHIAAGILLNLLMPSPPTAQTWVPDRHWVEAEAQLPDGRRVSGVVKFEAQATGAPRKTLTRSGP